MNLTHRYQGRDPVLDDFKHITEIVRLKNQTIRLGEWTVATGSGLQVVCVVEGKFDWLIDGQRYLLYPGDVALVNPWQSFGSPTDTLEIGALSYVTLQPLQFDHTRELRLGNWSGIAENEQRLMGKLLAANTQPVLNDLKIINDYIQKIENELEQVEFAYQTRINQLCDELLITIVRQLSRQQNQRRDFPQVFQNLEQMLRNNLDHPWTVEEMAAVVGLGSTAFTEKVKGFSGFSPLNYLINIRISEAMKQLKRSDKSLTDIALDTGFYSSQHFSTTFKKLTGYTPGQFRKQGKGNEE
jgi:AraC-like DNA-binding protein